MKGTAGCGLKKEFADGFKGLVFDVDGVIFDSRASNIEYYNLIRQAVQLPPISTEDEDFCHAASVGEALERIIPPERRELAFRACRQINYTERILPLLSLEPGLLETLHWLRQRNVRLAVFTNRSNSIEALLRHFCLESFFAPVMTAATGAPKPCPDGLLSIIEEWRVAPGQIAFLGDSRVDEQAAKSAGVPFWAFRNQALDARVHVPDFFKMIAWMTPLVEGRQ